MQTKIENFAKVLQAAQNQCMADNGFSPEVHGDNFTVRVHYGKKFARVDVGSSGRYMVELSTGNIFFIKAYGVVHRGHQFGTVDTLDQWDWRGYRAVRKPTTGITASQAKAAYVHTGPDALRSVVVREAAPSPATVAPESAPEAVAAAVVTPLPLPARDHRVKCTRRETGETWLAHDGLLMTRAMAVATADECTRLHGDRIEFLVVDTRYTPPTEAELEAGFSAAELRAGTT